MARCSGGYDGWVDTGDSVAFMWSRDVRHHPPSSAVLTSATRIIALLLVVARSKLVLDFSLTTTFLHLIVVSLYEHEVPRSLLWWALQFVITGVMVAGGTWACQWRELRPMSFGLGDGGNTISGTGGSYEMAAVEEEGEGETETEGEGKRVGRA